MADTDMITAMITPRNARLVVAMAAGAMLVVGCSGKEDSSDRWNSSAPTTSRDRLVLSAAEFPSGTTKVDLPQDKIQSAIGNIAALQQNATFTPAECGSTQQDLGAATKELLGQSSIAAATGKSSGMFIEYVSGRTGSLQRISDGNKRCGEVQMTSTVDGQQVTATEHVENLPLPQELKGANAIAYRTSSTATVGTGEPMTTAAYLGYAEVRGNTVVVRVGALQDSLDQATFEQFFVAAVQKVVNAT